MPIDTMIQPPKESSATDSRAHDALLFAILITLSGLSSYFLWAFAFVIKQVAEANFPGIPQTPLTMFFLNKRIGFLLIPVPWLLYAGYALMSGPRSARQLVFFASTLILTMLTVSIVATAAFALPWLSVIKGVGIRPASGVPRSSEVLRDAH